ncbi:MAG: OstA-like protein [Flavobacteriales bacterium]
MKVTQLLLISLALCCSLLMNAQSQPQRVKLIHTDELRYDKSQVDAQRLIGHVHLQLEGTTFFCDSAYLFTNDDFDAFGNIRILDTSGGTVTADFLHFDRATKLATLREHVVLRDKDMTLTTGYLTYAVDSEVAIYQGGGKIVSSANKNVLTSKNGTYYGASETFHFKRQVILKNPNYVVTCDTMQYNSGSEVTYFRGPTTITGDSTVIYCENGYYDSRKDESRFGKNARILDGTTLLKGDSIYYNGIANMGEVFGNVHIRDTTETMVISGDYGKHLETTKWSFVTGHALLTQGYDSDTLFMHADTLTSLPDSAGYDRVFAYHGVRFFKSDLQGVCDSLVYLQQDSTLWMFSEPIVWSAQSQVTGDTISLEMENQVLRYANVLSNAFMVSDAEASGDSIVGSEEKFNQIKGKRMRADFLNDALHHIRVEGNAELIYFPTDDKSGQPKTMGTNEGQCSAMLLSFENGELSRVRMEEAPKAVFKSTKFADSPLRMKEFKWLKAQRPVDRYAIFLAPQN